MIILKNKTLFIYGYEPELKNYIFDHRSDYQIGIQVIGKECFVGTDDKGKGKYCDFIGIDENFIYVIELKTHGIRKCDIKQTMRYLAFLKRSIKNVKGLVVGTSIIKRNKDIIDSIEDMEYGIIQNFIQNKGKPRSEVYKPKDKGYCVLTCFFSTIDAIYKINQNYEVKFDCDLKSIFDDDCILMIEIDFKNSLLGKIIMEGYYNFKFIIQKINSDGVFIKSERVFNKIGMYNIKRIIKAISMEVDVLRNDFRIEQLDEILRYY